ncbi:MAG: hypothetical protein JW782_03380 [Candidatus Saganbacteria bacterium]|nr:hypothetical protein [Candidatus Saganbacteria bacterium]
MKKRFVFLVLAACVSLMLTGCEDSLIFPTTTVSTTSSTTTTIGPDQAVLWAVGNSKGGYGMILHTTNGGLNWVRQGSPQEVPAVQLWSVCAIDDNNVWIVGDPDNGYPTILKTTDGGASWQRKSSAAYLGTDELLKISALDTMTAWVVGLNGTILRTTDGGDTWVKQNDSNVPAVQLQAVYALDSQHVWAGGGADSGYLTMVRSTNGGSSWVRQGSSSLEVTGENLIDIYALDENNVWATGGRYAILKTSDGGDHWVSQHQTVMGDCNGIFPLDVNTAWIAQDYGHILHTTDGGTTWDEQLSSQSGFGIYFLLMPRALNKNVCWIAGTNSSWQNIGVILRTTDGGASWEAQTMPEDCNMWGISISGVR